MKRKHLFLLNASILTGGSILLRFVGIWFRSYITGRIGASGMGLYQLVFSIFLLGITACTSGIGLAVTRLVAEGRGSRRCIRICILFGLSLSFAACAALFFSADFLALKFIGSEQAAMPLRLLAPGLPFIAACASLKGYFFAKRNTAIPVLGECWEQAVTIAASILLLEHSPLAPLDALMLGSTIGEIASVAFIVPAFLLYTRRHGLDRCADAGTFRLVVHIAVPMLLGSFLRSSLFSAENILIPFGLQENGAGATAALAQYGVVQGMVMPVLLFPLSLVSSAAMLMIPDIAEESAKKRQEAVRSSAARACRATLLFGFLTAAVFLAFADDMGRLFYNSEQAGSILRIMAPLAPLMYLDNMVDNLLKGLDQQMYSLKYNLYDSLLRVTFIAVFIPQFGIRAYLVILFASEIFNASLSIGRLLKVTSLKSDARAWLPPALLSGTVLYLLLCALKKALLLFI